METLRLILELGCFLVFGARLEEPVEGDSGPFERYLWLYWGTFIPARAIRPERPLMDPFLGPNVELLSLITLPDWGTEGP